LDESTREALNTYVRDLYAPEDALLREIREETRRENLPQISIRPEEGRMLQFLVAAVGAKKAVEVGTLAGYSGVWLARALPPDGLLYTLDISPKHAEVARQSFDKAGLDGRVQQRLGEAMESLADLSAEGPFDVLFIDAEKEDYPAYLEWGLSNVRPGGLILAHNAFWSGRLVDPAYQDHPGAQGLRAYHRTVAEDERLEGTVIPVGDGIIASLVVG
jgi:caffeoyl-CoA O-methyltransferase